MHRASAEIIGRLVWKWIVQHKCTALFRAPHTKEKEVLRTIPLISISLPSSASKIINSNFTQLCFHSQFLSEVVKQLTPFDK